MSETDDDKTDEVKEKLDDGETLGGTTDDSDMVLTLDDDEGEEDDE